MVRWWLRKEEQTNVKEEEQRRRFLLCFSFHVKLNERKGVWVYWFILLGFTHLG